MTGDEAIQRGSGKTLLPAPLSLGGGGHPAAPAERTGLHTMKDRHATRLLAAALLLGLSAFSALGADPPAQGDPAGGPPATAAVEERWGIRIEGLRRTSGGFMLDFRYRVTDAGKAAPLFSRRAHPYLIDQGSGAHFQVPNPPKTGPMRTSGQFEEGRVYWMFFANPGRFIQPGNRVTVVIGDFRAEDLTVE